MAITIKHPDGKADGSVACSGTVNYLCYGPPTNGYPFTKGVYIAQVSGATGTYRWLENINTPGVASPASFSYA